MGTPQHIWSVYCSGSSIDQRTNNISLFNIIEQIELHTKTGVVDVPKEAKNIDFRGELVSLWKKNGDDGAAEQLFEIVDPKGEVLHSKISPIEFSNSKRCRLTIQLNGLKVTIAGDYKFRISVKSKSDKNFTNMYDVPLEVIIKQ